jgi:tetratricopeptide (TPR) repeat protein
MRRAKRLKKKLKLVAIAGGGVLVVVGLVVMLMFLFKPSSNNNDGKPLTPKQLAAAKAERHKEKLDAMMDAADKLFDNADYDEACAKYQAVLDTDDNRSAAHLGLGKCFESNHDMDEAKKEYQKAIELNPETTAPYNRLAHALIENDKMRAKEVLLKGVEKFPEDEELMLSLANLCFETGDAGKALETYKKMDAGKLDLKDVRNFASLLEVESKEDAKKLLISAAKKFKNLSLYMSAGELANDQSDRIAILLDAEIAMANDNAHIDDLFFRIAKAYSDDGQNENVFTYLKKINIEKLDKNLYSPVFKLARTSGIALEDAILIKDAKEHPNSKKPKILALVLHLLKLAPKRIDIQILLLNELESALPTDEVLDIYYDLLTSKQSDPIACFLYATALKNASMVTTARKYFIKAVGLKTDFYEALFALSEIQMTLKQWKQAEISLNKCIKIKPKDFVPRELLIKSEIMMGKGEASLKQFALFLNTTPLSASQKTLKLAELAMHLPSPGMVDEYLTLMKPYPELAGKYKELEAKRKMLFGGARNSDFSSARKGLFRQYRIIHLLSQGKYRVVLTLHTPKDEFPDFWKVYIMLKKRIIKRKPYRPPVDETEKTKSATKPKVTKKKKDIIELLYEKTRTSKNLPEKIFSGIWNGDQNLQYAEKHLSQVPPDQLALYYILLAEEYTHAKQRTKARIRLRKAMSAPRSVYHPFVKYLYRQR